MTLIDFFSKVDTLTDAEAKEYALIFNQEVYLTLCEVQENLKNTKHKVNPVQLSNNQWALRADLLLEIKQGGLYYKGFTMLPTNLLDQVDVDLWENIIKLLPVE